VQVALASTSHHDRVKGSQSGYKRATIQNGMDRQEWLKTIVGREHAMGGATYITGAKIMHLAERLRSGDGYSQRVG